jgi:hypothetical protein
MQDTLILNRNEEGEEIFGNQVFGEHSETGTEYWLNV